MKRFIPIIFLLFISQSYAQQIIDLKPLIGVKQEKLIKTLSDWGVKVAPSTEYSGTLEGFDRGIQIEIKNGKANTIWITFADGDAKGFPFQVDQVITPNVEIKKVIEFYGKPNETGLGFKMGENETSGWAKWLTKSYQLHCQVSDSKVTMVTIMEPGWYPGKD